MPGILRMPAAHASRLERWLGPELIRALSRASVGRDLMPIPLANVPGAVKTYDGDFVGTIRGGSFSSLSDLINEMSGGKAQYLNFSKAGGTGIVAVANDLWPVGTVPVASAATPALPGGESPTNLTQGSFLHANAGAGDTLHFIGAIVNAAVAGQLLLLYDLFFHGSHDMTVTPRTVTGIPTRYQDIVTSKGTFITVLVTTPLPAATPTYTITYVDDGGHAEEAAAAQTIVTSSIARRFPFAAAVGGGWRIPLNAGDAGVQKLTNLALSGAMASGVVDVVLGKPLAWLPCVAANIPFVVDGINSMMSLTQIVDNACLALLEVQKAAVTATNYNGVITLCSG